MKAYIEIVICDNLILTSVISILSYVAIGVKPRKLRTLFASILGTAMSVISPLINLPLLLNIVIKLSVGVLLAFVLHFKVSRLFSGIISFFAITAAVGGIAFMVNYLLTSDLEAALSIAPVLPYGVCAIGAIVLFTALKLTIRAVRIKRAEMQYIMDAEVTVCGRRIVLKAFFDSGNGLIDERTMLPIVVIKLTSLTKHIGLSRLMQEVSGQKDAYVLGGKTSKLYLIRPEKFVLYLDGSMNKNSDVMLGLSVSGFSRREDMLLGPSILGGNNV